MPSTENFINLEEERIHIGEKVLRSNYAPIAQEFLKRGAPRALRGRLWSLVLGSVVKENVETLFIIKKQKGDYLQIKHSSRTLSTTRS